MPKFESPIFIEIFGSSSPAGSLGYPSPDASKSTDVLGYEKPTFKWDVQDTAEANRIIGKALCSELLGQYQDELGLTKNFTGTLPQTKEEKHDFSKLLGEKEMDFVLDELGHAFSKWAEASIKPVAIPSPVTSSEKCPCDCVACGRDNCAECQADEKCETCVTLNSTYPERKAAKSADAQMHDLDKRTCSCGKHDPGTCSECEREDFPHRISRLGHIETLELVPDRKTLCEMFKISDPDEAHSKWKKFCER